MIRELSDPTNVLVPPAKVDGAADLKSLQSSAGFMVGNADRLAMKFFHFSLIEQIVRPAAGDWTQLEFAARGWDQMAVALGATADNIAAGAAQIPAVWQGEAAEAAGRMVVDFADLHKTQSDGCHLLAEQLRHIVEVSKAAGETIATGLSVINDLLMQIAAEAAAVVIGWVVGAATAGFKAYKFWSWVQKMLTAIQRVMKVIQLVMKVVGVVKKLMGSLATIGHSAAGGFMDDTARVEFGVG